MTALNLGNPGAYYLSGTWQWYTPRLDIRDEGWKLHVSGDQHNAQRILDLVLNELREGGIAHKVLPDTEAVEKQTGEQRGKFFAIYPDSIEQAFVIISEIDRFLGAEIDRNDSPSILYERWVGRTVVYTRYGAYANRVWNPIKEVYDHDTIGQLKPDWIEDPWIYYPDMGMLKHFKPWPKHAVNARRKRGNRV